LGEKYQTQEVIWTVVPESHPGDERSNDVITDGMGLKILTSCKIVLANIFLHIAFIDWQDKLQRINAAIEAENSKPRSGKKNSFVYTG
jgi:hypothetical protein